MKPSETDIFWILVWIKLQKTAFPIMLLCSVFYPAAIHCTQNAKLNYWIKKVIQVRIPRWKLGQDPARSPTKTHLTSQQHSGTHTELSKMTFSSLILLLHVLFSYLHLQPQNECSQQLPAAVVHTITPSSRLHSFELLSYFNEQRQAKQWTYSIRHLSFQMVLR